MEPAITKLPTFLLTGIGSPNTGRDRDNFDLVQGVFPKKPPSPPTCDEGLVCHGASFNHFPVDGELPSGQNFDDVAPLDQVQNNLLLAGAHTGSAKCW